MSEIIHINSLALGQMPGISVHTGGHFAEAASVCLELQDHNSGVCMKIDGDFDKNVVLTWDQVTAQIEASQNDHQDATEHGAYGIAALLVENLMELTVTERSYKGTGFDYWLGKKDSDSVLFQKSARLEASGILEGSGSKIRTRVKAKLKQTQPSDGTLLPAIVVVVEYSSPQSRVVRK